MLDNTVVFVVTQGEEGVAALGAVAQGQVVLLDETGAGCLLEPVCVACRSGACRIQILVHADIVEGGNAIGVISPVVNVSEGVHIGVEAVVDVTLPHYAAEFLGVENLHAVYVTLGRDACVKVHLYLSFLATLCGNDDNTVCSS